MSYEPSYVRLYEEGILEDRIQAFSEIIKECKLCPHKCGINRNSSKGGKCKSGHLPIISSFSPHFGEESCLVGRRGSGTIFFTNCNLSCIFCQNYDISHLGSGKEISFKELSAMMIFLQERGCHNINLVTPTHMIYAILKALMIAIGMGLRLPLVYNSGGYDCVEVIRLLDGIFDIYMPDLKYMDSDVGWNLSGAKDYPDVSTDVIKEMHRQVGDIQLDCQGVAQRGLLVRHLVLPNNLAASDRVISFIADLSRNTYLNIMDQYRPAYRSRECFDLRRRITIEEYDTIIDIALNSGLTRLDRI